MKKNKLNKKRELFRRSITPKIEAIITAFIAIALIFFSTYLLYIKSVDSLEEEIKIGLQSNVSAAASIINGDLHQMFTKDFKREDSLYISQIVPLENIRKAAKDIRYIYTNILIDDKVYFILNPSPQNDNNNDGLPDVPPALMDEYKNPAPALLKALKGQKNMVSGIYTDEWGVFISSYAPFYDSNGQFVGTLGMDLELNNFYERLRPIEIAFEKTVIIIIFIGLVIGLLIWYIRKYTQRLLVIKDKSDELQQTFQKSRENTSKEHIQIVKKIKNNLEYLGPSNIIFYEDFKIWITHVIAYQKSKITHQNKPLEDFRINDVIHGVKQNMAREGITLNVDKKEFVSPVSLGPPSSLVINLISILVFFIKKTTQCDTVDMMARQLDESINHMIIELKLSGIRHHKFEEKFLEQLCPEINFTQKFLDFKPYKMATAINLIETYQSKVISYSNLQHSGVYIHIRLCKYPETN